MCTVIIGTHLTQVQPYVCVIPSVVIHLHMIAKSVNLTEKNKQAWNQGQKVIARKQDGSSNGCISNYTAITQLRAGFTQF